MKNSDQCPDCKAKKDERPGLVKWPGTDMILPGKLCRTCQYQLEKEAKEQNIDNSSPQTEDPTKL